MSSDGKNNKNKGIEWMKVSLKYRRQMLTTPEMEGACLMPVSK